MPLACVRVRAWARTSRVRAPEAVKSFVKCLRGLALRWVDGGRVERGWVYEAAP